MKNKKKIIPLTLALGSALCVATTAAVVHNSCVVNNSNRSNDHLFENQPHEIILPPEGITGVEVEVQPKYPENELAAVVAHVFPAPDKTKNEKYVGLQYVWYLDGVIIPHQDDRTKASNSFHFPVGMEQNGKVVTVKILYNNKVLATSPGKKIVVEKYVPEKPDNTIIIVSCSIGGVIVLALILLLISNKMKKREEG